MAGLRKNAKIKHLQWLNIEYNLGYSKKEINNMSVNQLKKIIFETKKEYGLRIPSHSTLLRLKNK